MPTISAHQALEMGTINGAKSLGIDAWVRSLAFLGTLARPLNLRLNSMEVPQGRVQGSGSEIVNAGRQP